MEAKGLRVNIHKTKIMKSGTSKGPVFALGKYPRGVCKKGVGRNSIHCTFCKHWIHKRCSGLKGRLINSTSFKCLSCLHLQENNDDTQKIRLNNIKYERVEKFCYLGDMLSAGGGVEANCFTCIHTGWKKFRELLPLLTSRVFSHKMKKTFTKLASGVLCCVVVRHDL